MVNNLPASIKRKLWILREPRGCSYNKSRYVCFMRGMGFGRDRRKIGKKSSPHMLASWEVVVLDREREQRRSGRGAALNPFRPGGIAHNQWLLLAYEDFNHANTVQQRPAGGDVERGAIAVPREPLISQGGSITPTPTTWNIQYNTASTPTTTTGGPTEADFQSVLDRWRVAGNEIGYGGARSWRTPAAEAPATTPAPGEVRFFGTDAEGNRVELLRPVVETRELDGAREGRADGVLQFNDEEPPDDEYSQ